MHNMLRIVGLAKFRRALKQGFESIFSGAFIVSILDLDPVLVDAVSSKRAVLFLGAGASIGATRLDGQKIPDAAKLGAMLSKEFLQSAYDAADFKTIYELSCSTRSVRDVQDYVHKVLLSYNPAPFHLLIPKFAWS
jgi:hypothetical protein